MGQLYVNAGKGDGHDEEEDAGLVSTHSTSLDAILDEIDTVLESNAQEFVQGFVQKGGQ